MELFGWRKFKNRREVGSAVGLTPTPYSSGTSDRCQGISKLGRGTVRGLVVQLAWGWLKYQPNSALTKWFHERFGEGKRNRRVGIVALSRKLVIAWWRYLEQDQLPEGVKLKAA